MSNPLTELRAIVASALLQNPPLLERLGAGDVVAGVHRIQVHDRAMDIRGTLEDSALGDCSVHLTPTGFEHDFDAHDSFVLRASYRIEIFHRDNRASEIEEIVWMVLAGLAHLYMDREPFTADPISVPEPLILNSIRPDAAETDREPGMEDTEEWTTAARIVASVRIPLAGLMEWFDD